MRLGVGSDIPRYCDERVLIDANIAVVNHCAPPLRPHGSWRRRRQQQQQHQQQNRFLPPIVCSRTNEVTKRFRLFFKSVFYIRQASAYKTLDAPVRNG